MCAGDSRMPEGDADEFRDFCRILEALFHFEFHRRLETLKNCYAPFNPDPEDPGSDNFRTHAIYDYGDIFGQVFP